MRFLIAFLLFITPAAAAECPVPIPNLKRIFPMSTSSNVRKTNPIASLGFAASSWMAMTLMFMSFSIRMTIFV